MRLDREDTAMLAGDQGAAVQLAMEILVKMGAIQAADRMVPIRSALLTGQGPMVRRLG